MKSFAERTAELIMLHGDYVTVEQLSSMLNIPGIASSNVLRGIKRSGRYTTDEVIINDRMAIRVTSINDASHGTKKKWRYSKLEIKERSLWDIAIFGERTVFTEQLV